MKQLIRTRTASHRPADHNGRHRRSSRLDPAVQRELAVIVDRRQAADA